MTFDVDVLSKLIGWREARSGSVRLMPTEHLSILIWNMAGKSFIIRTKNGNYICKKCGCIFASISIVSALLQSLLTRFNCIHNRRGSLPNPICHVDQLGNVVNAIFTGCLVFVALSSINLS